MNIEGDVVLIHYQDQPTMYARIEAIQPDIKKDWYQVTLLMLTIPPQTVTWILREGYFNGEPFTMGGVPMIIEEVRRVDPPEGPDDFEAEYSKKNLSKSAKIIPFKTNKG